MSIKLKFEDLKTTSFDQITQEGIYILQFDDLIQGVTQKGDTKYEMSHKIVNTNLKVNYDNYVLYNKQGEILAFGTNKLRKLIEATGIIIEEITPKLLKTLLQNKLFKAKLILSDKGFPQINYSEIYPMSWNEQPAINQTPTESSVPVKEKEKEKEEEPSEEIEDIIDTTDI